MKIDVALRDSYERHARIARALKEEVDRDILKRKRDAWHYESRIKSDESFALKVEAGRVRDIAAVEDVFGATIVVQDANRLVEAESMVLEKYELQERRPKEPAKTSKRPHEFLFDDVRLYVRYRRSPGERSAIPDGAIFEVQVKTFLQHAWAVSTHDLIYKSQERDWRRERIAHQVRATLEQAEVTIAGIEALAVSDVLPTVNDEVNEVNAIISELKADWGWPAALPADVRRLAEAIRVLLLIVDNGRSAPRPEILRSLLDIGKERNAGSHNIDWSPYRSVLSYIAQQHKRKLTSRLTARDNRVAKIFIYPETLTILGISRESLKTGVVLDV